MYTADFTVWRVDNLTGSLATCPSQDGVIETAARIDLVFDSKAVYRVLSHNGIQLGLSWNI